ncbi:hypothetical protein AtNW77_Chr5g0113391 [Arabidopsis thaliana]
MISLVKPVFSSLTAIVGIRRSILAKLQIHPYSLSVTSESLSFTSKASFIISEFVEFHFAAAVA